MEVQQTDTYAANKNPRTGLPPEVIVPVSDEKRTAMLHEAKRSEVLRGRIAALLPLPRNPLAELLELLLNDRGVKHYD
jgi:hypothetical protein